MSAWLLVWLDTIIQGVLLGGLYALYATGLSLIFGIMRLVNLAHGDLMVAAAYLILSLAQFAGINTVVAFAISLPLMFGVGYLLQLHLLNRTLGEDILPPLLVTFGISIVIQNALLQGFSADTRRLPIGGISNLSVPLGGGIAVGIMPLLSLAAAIAVVFGLNQLFYHTRLGRALRATSDDTETAQLVGINNQHIYAIAMGLALAVCAVAAFFLGSRSTFDPTTGPARLIYAFEAVIIGGLGSLWGTLAGGIVVGVAQTVGARINPEWQILAGHVAFLVVLILRPRGFFPRAFD
jgi:branched-chain amino acid transport system permease protein